MVLIGTRGAVLPRMRLSRIVPLALLLGLGGWAVARFIRSAGGVSADAEGEADDLGDPVFEVVIIEESVAELH